jgi:hypothetical protein
VLKVAGMSLPMQEAERDSALNDLVLVRIAGARSGLDKGLIAADLAPFAGPQMPASRWRGAIDAALDALTAAGLIAARPGGFVATKPGAVVAAKFLGAPASFVVAWEQACNIWLIGKVLGVKRSPAKRLAALATADGLRAAILVQAYGLSFKGKAIPTPTRLRQALAAAALKRAFGGGQGAGGLADKLGLSARASRLLAAQLLDKPRDPGTDRRLVSALAVQACGAAAADLPALRAAVLRRGFAAAPPSQPTETAQAPRSPTPETTREVNPAGHGSALARQAQVAAPAVTPRRPAPPVASSPAGQPLDLPGFASEVRRCAAGEAQGWSGDRKAYISRVWRSLRQQRPDWGLSEIEFKGLLAEAHRLGELALANADLKDASNIKDVQDSALIYKNAVFHFIRVEA